MNESGTTTYSVMTVANLEELVGLRLLPGVPQHVRDNGMVLPKPTKQSGGKRKRGGPAPEIEYGLSNLLTRALENILKRFR